METSHASPGVVDNIFPVLIQARIWNLNKLRKCCRNGRFSTLFYALESKEEVEWGSMESMGGLIREARETKAQETPWDWMKDKMINALLLHRWAQDT